MGNINVVCLVVKMVRLKCCSLLVAAPSLLGEPVCRGPWERWGEARRSAGSWDILSWMEDQPVLGFENTE